MRVAVVLLGAACALATAAPVAHGAGGAPRVEAVVELEAPPLARALEASRVFTAAARRERLHLRTPTSVSYLRGLAAQQQALARRIEQAIPGARVGWRYRIVLNGLAVSLPADRVSRLSSLPGVRGVYPSVRYRARLDRSPRLIGAPDLWGPGLTTAGNGMKIGIVDDGIDQTHPFFDPRGFSAPAGFPKGQRAYTTGKVIVARSFPPPSPTWKHAGKPFDPQFSEHGTHVAGIAAGNNGVVPGRGRAPLSGVAPQAYLGNYRVLTIPTASGVGLDGNGPEIAAGIEAAVRDGMDVINLSLGEPEIEPSRDVVVAAMNAAAAAGVVPVVAAGNDFAEFGRGSVGSPGSAARAITVAAVSKAREIADFSSGGPTPVSLQLKPDVSAPGVAITSSVPAREGTWDEFSGTSMAAPHVAGGAALLRQRHPEWTVEQLKSALVSTGVPVLGAGGQAQVASTRQGGGLIDLRRADTPLLLPQPASVSFGFLRPGTTAEQEIELADAGGGEGVWSVSVERSPASPGATVRVPATVTVPGTLVVAAQIDAAAREREVGGFVVLTRGTDVRRIPYWLRVNIPTLGRPARSLARSGTYIGDTRRGAARVARYGYPEYAGGASTSFAGPEQVFRIRIARPVANFGVAIVGRGRGVTVTARTLRAGDEQRQVGYTSLPLNLNPYLPSFLQPRPVSGAVRPTAGLYDIVFDSPSRARAGVFTFRFWIGDTEPPTLSLLGRVARREGDLELRATDGGSGLDPRSVIAQIDGRQRGVSVSGRLIRIDLSGLQAGRHGIVVQASDYQETRNMENVLRILPNTRRLTASFTIR
ncbi:MAG: S8 family serine peptidase [Actinobacteria bacterium]|nr:S8 family serine peptidase [Actinomycetota bacterium]